MDLGLVPTPLLLAGAIPLLFLLGFVVLAAWGKRMGGGGWLAVTLGGIAAAVAITLTIKLAATKYFTYGDLHINWFRVGDHAISVGIDLDIFSLIMLALVCGITLLVQIFSLAYIAHDEMRHRYWAYLSLFAGAMCGLVLADNLLLMFVFWELVGLASYLLIGFWFKEKLPAMASQKAFIVNRIADAGFIMALMMVWAQYGTFNFEDLTDLHRPANFLIGLGLFIGAIGKSAQFPFQVWLPDAMAGPTPASSLIHAATMVVAGVYLLLRTLRLMPDEIRLLMAVVGAATALLAAISALTQTDIKRVLAYSTVSQLGFMVMSIGVGDPISSFLHLIAHAFFKCGLFLVAGAVIHQLHAAQEKNHLHFDAQDMRFMGGLRRQMPLVFVAWCFFAAALAGLPLFSGFLSKDGILISALDFGEKHGSWAWLVPGAAILASLLTAFYIARQGVLVFLGKNRAQGAGAGADFLSAFPKLNWRMAVPLVVLALGSTWLILSPTNPFHMPGTMTLYASHETDYRPWIFAGLAAFGIALAAFIYRKGPLPSRDNFLFDLSFKHFFLDEIYEALLVKPFLALSRLFALIDHYVVDGAVRFVAGLILRKGHRPSLSEGAEWIDHHLIDPAVNETIQPHENHSLSRASAWLDLNLVDRIVSGVASLVMRAGKSAGQVQSGKLQQYILYTLLSLLLLLLIMIFIFTA
jgi:NADH-quinone oxidoreductase subunit L